MKILGINNFIVSNMVGYLSLLYEFFSSFSLSIHSMGVMEVRSRSWIICLILPAVGSWVSKIDNWYAEGGSLLTFFYANPWAHSGQPFLWICVPILREFHWRAV